MRVYKEMAIQKALRPVMTEEEALEEAYRNGSPPLECKDAIDKQLKITNNQRCVLELEGAVCRSESLI